MSQRHASSEHAVVTLTRERAQIERLEQLVLTSTAKFGYSAASQFAIRLALEEAVSNAFRHGHKELGEHVPVTVEMDIGKDRVRISVEDQGPGFKPDAVPDPTLDENLELPSGRGLMLIRAYMTSVSHSDRGNKLIMEYVRPGGTDTSGS